MKDVAQPISHITMVTTLQEMEQKEIKKDLGLVNEFDMMESLNRKQD